MDTGGATPEPESPFLPLEYFGLFVEVGCVRSELAKKCRYSSVGRAGVL